MTFSAIWLTILSALVAGILSIDRNAFGQFQLSRPIVSALIMGVILGCPVEGAIVGLIYEVLFLGSIGLAVLFGAPTAFLDRAVNVQWRRSNERAFHRAMVYLRLGRTDLVQLQHVLSALRAGLYHGGSFLLTGAVLIPSFNLLLKSPGNFPERFAVVAMLPFFIGLAGLASDRTSRKGWKGFTLGLALGACFGIWRTLS
jgi:hypothetical protein